MTSRSARSRRRGSSLIETALLLPVAVLLTLGGFDFSRLYMLGAQLESAASAAAAQAARSPDELQTARTMALSNLPADSDAEVWIEMVCACSTAPGQWGACEQTRCESGFSKRYARATVSARFATLGRYPGVAAASRLQRQHFMRTD